MIADIVIAATRFVVGGHPLWQGSIPEMRQRIYFANHSSHMDSILLWAALPKALRRNTHPVAASDYWGKSALRRFVAIKVLNAVLVDRHNRKDPLGPLLDVLQQGHSLILFPEGTRGDEPLPAPFKSGLMHLARAHPDAQLIPVYLGNLARAYPKGAILPAPISCFVRFGPPLALIEGEAKPEFLVRAHSAVCALAAGISS